MPTNRRLFSFLSLILLGLSACQPSAQPPTPTTLPTPIASPALPASPLSTKPASLTHPGRLGSNRYRELQRCAPLRFYPG